MLSVSTHVYATHEIALECDVYSDTSDLSQTDGPVFLYFHPGGLVGGARTRIAPWLVQACWERKWPLISPSYRLLPQTGAQGLLQDATAAYEFAKGWGAGVTGTKRPVIVGGGSAGFFMANLVAHHASPPPAAMFCISGIATFRHSFFNSSTLLTPEPITDDEMAAYIQSPVEVGTMSVSDPAAFSVGRLLPSGLKNGDYKPPPATTAEKEESAAEYPRGCLYDYYLYRNDFIRLVGDVDPGFEWAKQNPDGDKLRDWPFTVFIQGDADEDASPGVTTDTVAYLGSEKAKLHLVAGEGHLFESLSYLEDEGPAMDIVRDALQSLDTGLSI